MKNQDNPIIAIIGLGYVGLPLAVAFSEKYQTIGFDINAQRVSELLNGIDRTLEVDAPTLAAAKETLAFTTDAKMLESATVYIVTVPTPIDAHKSPNLKPLEGASRLIGSVINVGDVVIYESTVYPGCTEEACIPLVEEVSSLKYNKDFYAGYSPERINPGDKTHRVTNIVKVTSGSTPEIADFVDNLYSSIITAGTHKAESIAVAEAAKVIENTQRDVNIALVNELAIIFNRLGIDTQAVLEAAGSKWNFLPFKPGLVGGHCISVDPYYLTHKAQEIGYHPEIILSGRRINDNMGSYVAESVIKLMMKQRLHVVDSKVLILGLAFKENCPDLRNTRVIDIIDELDKYHANVDVYDPWVSQEEANNEFGFTLTNELIDDTYDAIILCVGHKEFAEMGAKAIRRLGKSKHVLYDVKHLFSKQDVDGRL